MAIGSYEVQVEDGKCLQIDMVPVEHSARALAPDIVEAPRKRSPAMIWLDCFVAFLILGLPASFMLATPLFIANLAAVLAIVLCAYLKVVCLMVAAMSSPDTPHIVAIIQAPEQLHCPRCGEPKTKKYCSGCGVNTEKAYRKLVRQLAYYAIEDTKEQRVYLETSVKGYLQGVVQKQQREIALALEKMERNYVMEIARQHKALRAYQHTLMPPSSDSEARPTDAGT